MLLNEWNFFSLMCDLNICGELKYKFGWYIDQIKGSFKGDLNVKKQDCVF